MDQECFCHVDEDASAADDNGADEGDNWVEESKLSCRSDEVTADGDGRN